jgi:hypothetical protein
VDSGVDSFSGRMSVGTPTWVAGKRVSGQRSEFVSPAHVGGDTDMGVSVIRRRPGPSKFAFCLLPFAFCLLPFAFCLLPFASVCLWPPFLKSPV